MKTSELIGPALDWAVAKCEGVELRGNKGFHLVYLHTRADGSTQYRHWNPSTDWAQGGRIIERDRINIRDEVTQFSSWMWDSTRCGDVSYYGPTPLIASMRCYVASKLGEEIEIPEELK
jgi:hypothetical protein